MLERVRTALSSIRVPASVTAAAWLVAAIVVVGGWAWGVPLLRARVDAQPVDPATVDVRFVDPPAWMHGDLEAHLVLTAMQQVRGQVLDRDELVGARRALLETGWFERVDQVRRVEPALIEVEATFVRPYAVVRDGDGDHLVSPDGRLLPRSAPIGGAGAFTAILHASKPRPERAGLAWPGADLTAALRLKRLIDGRPWHAQIAAIDVGRFAASGELDLVTDRGQTIRWGRAPGDEAPGEVDVGRKLYYLDYPFEHFGHVDGGYDGPLDITDPRGVFGR